MTTEQRYVLDLVDVLAIRLDCAKCGSALAISPTHWMFVPSECPGCRADLSTPPSAGQTALQRFAQGLKGLLAEMAEGELPYRVRLEAPNDAGPKAPTPPAGGPKRSNAGREG